MGGIGSGRRYQGGKNTTKDSRPLDIRKLNRSGLLQSGCSFGWQWTINDRPIGDIQIQVQVDHVVLAYKYQQHRGAEWEDVRQPVYFDHTPCNLGGRRAWFLCPARGCGRRVAVLYGGSIFACRHCHNLVYECQRETDDDRAARRADTIRRRLGWEPGILNGDGNKPKGMHWSTYQRLTIKHDAFVGVSLAGMAKRFGMIETRLGGIDEDLNLFRKIGV